MWAVGAIVVVVLVLVACFIFCVFKKCCGKKKKPKKVRERKAGRRRKEKEGEGEAGEKVRGPLKSIVQDAYLLQISMMDTLMQQCSISCRRVR